MTKRIRVIYGMFSIIAIMIVVMLSINKNNNVNIQSDVTDIPNEDVVDTYDYEPDLTKDWEEILIQAISTGDYSTGMSADNHLYLMYQLGRIDYKLNYYDVLYLAKIIEKEDGYQWPDWAIMAIGEVVLNRVASPEWPSSIYGVLTQTGQYAPVNDADWETFIPTEKYVRLAVRLLSGERVIYNEEVLYQALFEQSDGYVIAYYDIALGTTTYFCR